MGSMDVGWSDLGSWSSLLAGLAGRAGLTPDDAGGMSGRVIQSGEAVDVGPDDLLVLSKEGRLAVEAPAGDRFVSDGVSAHLAGARQLQTEVRALLDRVAHQEERV
jgi:hypothetical protein